MTTPLTWHDVLADEKQQPYFLNTLKTVAERASVRDHHLSTAKRRLQCVSLY